MNAIAERFKEQGVGSIFLYTHEAHPGENYPHLTSMEQKHKHAGGVTGCVWCLTTDFAGCLGWGLSPSLWIDAQYELDFYPLGAPDLQIGLDRRP